MRTGLKAAVVVLPFLVVFLLIRSCSEGEGERWRDRVRDVDPDAVLGVVEDDLIVIAPSPAKAAEAAATLRGFRRGLVEEYGDLVGRPSRHRLVVVQFSSGERLRKHAGERMVHDPERAEVLQGYADPAAGAIFLPPEILPRTLRHETVHWIMGAAFRGAAPHSPWVSEGLAQLFEIYEPDARPPVPPGIGWVDRQLMREHFRQDALDVDRLLGLEDYRDFVLEDGPRNYLEALVLTAFLFLERPRESLAKYLRTERVTPVGRRTAFHTIYRHREEPFVGDLRAFIARMKR